MQRSAPLLALAAALAATTALANDSTAEKAAGGLVLTRTDAIDMVSEDLYVSPDQVRVQYVFRNRTRAPIRTTVAFPMPDRDLDEMYLSDTNYPGQFRTLVDGRPVTMQVERRAMLNGVDHTAMLTGTAASRSMIGDPASDLLTACAASACAPADRRRLTEIGAGRATAAANCMRCGRSKETYYWEQVFPAGRDLNVEHSYSARHRRLGRRLFGASATYRDSAEGRADATPLLHRPRFPDRARPDGRRAIAHRIVMTQQNLSYILTTGGNWRSPIGSFRLVVDKRQPARDHELLRRGRAPDLRRPSSRSAAATGARPATSTS